MNPDEAIEILQFEVDNTALYQDTNLEISIKLGIEALKRELQHRQDVETNSPWLLPGESED